MRPRVGCICALVGSVENRTPVLVIQHPRERKHPFNTVRLLRLGLRRATLQVASHDFEERASCEPDPQPGDALLMPGPGAADLAALPPEARPRRLVMVDGTWPQARKLLRDNPWIAALPRVCLRPSRPGNYRIRREPRPECLSTIEAIVEALRILEPETVGLDALLEAFYTMIDRQIGLAADARSHLDASNR
jgi:DTW domain-containing protein